MRSLRSVLNQRGFTQRGFTLAELLVVTALVGLVMASVLSFLMSSNQSYQRGTNQVEAQPAARVAMARMAQEIREAGYNPFEYLDVNDATTAAAGNVRTVVMSATVSQFTGSSAAINPANVVLTNRILLRNKQ